MEQYKKEFIDFMPAWFPDFLKCRRNIVFSRNFGLWLKRQMYRNLLQIGVISHQNGVVNGVVECSWFGDGDVKYHKEKSVETHVLAERRGRGFLRINDIQ